MFGGESDNRGAEGKEGEAEKLGGHCLVFNTFWSLQLPETAKCTNPRLSVTLLGEQNGLLLHQSATSVVRLDEVLHGLSGIIRSLHGRRDPHNFDPRRLSVSSGIGTIRMECKTCSAACSEARRYRRP